MSLLNVLLESFTRFCNNIDSRQAAVASLEAEGLAPKFHLCDLGDLASVEALRDTMLERWPDVLMRT